MEDGFGACAAFARALGGAFAREGRIAEHWTDGPGRGVLRGAKWGLTAAAWPTLDIEGMDEAGFETIVHRHFWAPMRCAEIYAGPDLMLFDFAVERGLAESARALRRALGIRGAAIDDELIAEARTRCPADLIEDLADQQRAIYEADSRYPLFGLGWDRRLYYREDAAKDRAADARRECP